MNNAKIQFSEKELNLATDIAFILTKNRIIEKVYNLFGLLSDSYLKLSKGWLPPEILSTSPKISRGENYNDLPYVMLDYPRFFSKEDVFAIRTMFWWGNDLSLTLHLKGKFRHEYQSRLLNFTQYKNQMWYLQLSENEWLHHKNEHTHEKITDLTLPSIKEHRRGEPGFLKIACFHPLQEWNNAISFFENDFSTLIKTLGRKI